MIAEGLYEVLKLVLRMMKMEFKHIVTKERVKQTEIVTPIGNLVNNSSILPTASGVNTISLNRFVNSI